jgi:hypothetical protein
MGTLLLFALSDSSGVGLESVLQLWNPHTGSLTVSKSVRQYGAEDEDGESRRPACRSNGLAVLLLLCDETPVVASLLNERRLGEIRCWWRR